MITRTGHNNCPTCKAILDAATGVNEEDVPNPHDITICFYCGEILEFTYDMDLRILSETEIDDLDMESFIYFKYAQESIRNIKK